MTPKILKKLKEMNFKIFTQGSYNINIIGIRTPSRVANAFDDFIYVVYKDDDIIGLKRNIVVQLNPVLIG